jgi:hypothetical protein
MAAVVQTVLEGIALPATRDELLDYARRQGAPPDALAALADIPDREYERLDDVGEAIFRVQPPSGPPPAPVPRPETGEFPGGEAYLDRASRPGAIRDEPETPPYEEKLVREP